MFPVAWCMLGWFHLPSRRDSSRQEIAVPLPYWLRFIDCAHVSVTNPSLSILRDSFLPKEITGLLARKGALKAIYVQQWALEKAKEAGLPLQGVTLDLRKCFNLLRRSQIRKLFLRLGIPCKMVEQWFGSLMSLTRYWDLQKYASLPIPSTTGCPEGDSWSVLAMVMVCLTWTTLITEAQPLLSSSAFADNWTWWGPEHVHSSTLRLTLWVCDFLGLQVGWSKTWLWSTNHAGRAPLQTLLKQTVPDAQVHVCTQAVDLGCQVTYSKHAVFGKPRERIDKAKRRLARLQKQT